MARPVERGGSSARGKERVTSPRSERILGVRFKKGTVACRRKRRRGSGSTSCSWPRAGGSSTRTGSALISCSSPVSGSSLRRSKRWARISRRPGRAPPIFSSSTTKAFLWSCSRQSRRPRPRSRARTGADLRRRAQGSLRPPIQRRCPLLLGPQAGQSPQNRVLPGPEELGRYRSSTPIRAPSSPRRSSPTT